MTGSTCFQNYSGERETLTSGANSVRIVSPVLFARIHSALESVWIVGSHQRSLSRRRFAEAEVAVRSRLTLEGFGCVDRRHVRFSSPGCFSLA